ncbi:MAG: ribosome recycling factor [Chthoniobacterales bacterium]
MSIEETLFEAEESMEKALDYLMHEFATIRTGKASPALVENIDIEAYGSNMKLKQLALISTPESRLIVIQPFDATVTKDIERGLKESRLGITPISDGKIIRLPIPELSEERRKDLAKSIKQIAEDTRVRVRGARRTAMDGIKKLEKDGKIAEDELHTTEKEVQTLTDKYSASIDKHLETKEADIMKV